MSGLSHIGSGGEANMVDVSAKPVTVRWAEASGRIRMLPGTLALIRADGLAKGDVIAVARVAGIMAAKRTSELVPLCHPIPLTDVQVTVSLDDTDSAVIVRAHVRSVGQTGVEMEALTAVTVTLLTVYDMAKSVDRGMIMEQVGIDEKGGGVSGLWRRETSGDR